MSQKYISVFLFVAASIVLTPQVDAISVKCKGQDVEINEQHVMEMKECFSVIGISSHTELSAANAGCFSKCVMMKKGLIDDAGKPHKENINKLMDEHLPDFVKGELMAAMGKCLETEGPKVDAKAADCSSFLPLSMCAHMAFMNVCKS